MLNIRPKQNSALPYRPDIDGLRAIAVLSVIIFHYFPSQARGGFIGVDIFFVISGFLITGIIIRNLEANRFSFWDFYSRRILRIFPALLTVLLVALFAGWHVLFADEFKALGKHIFGGAAFISNILYWAESGYFDSSAIGKPLLHLWSLGIEEQFYIIFPLILYFSYKKKIHIGTIVLIFFFLSFVVNISAYKQNPDMDFYSPVTRFWEFLCGSLLALPQRNGQAIRLRLLAVIKKLPFSVSEKISERTIPAIIAFLGLALIIVVIFTLGGQLFPGFRALFPVAGAMLVIMAGQHNIINRKLLSNTFAVSIGLISYPLYLWHWPILSFAHTLGGEVNSAATWLFIRLCGIVLTFILAFATYKCIEAPIRFGGRARSARAYGLLVLMIFAGGAGLAVEKTGGAPQRQIAQEKTFAPDMTAFPERQNAAGIQYALQAVPSVPLSAYPEGSFIKANILPEAKGTVAILGDSHAWAAYPGIARRNAANNLNTILVAEGAGRSPFVGVRASRNDELQKVLNQKAEAWLDYLASDPSVKQVYIFSMYICAKRPSFQPSMQRTIDRVNTYEKKAFIVADVPALLHNSKQMAERPFSLRRAASVEGLSKASILKNQAKYLSILHKLDDAIIIDTVIDAFCESGYCITISSSGFPLYLDKDHLSPWGSDFLVSKVLEPYLFLLNADE